MQLSGTSPVAVADRDAVDQLLLRAFAGPDEAELVRALRRDGAMVLEEAVRAEGDIVAYLGLSRMVEPVGWLALAPVAVDPGWQGQGLGSRLVRDRIAQTVQEGRTVVVLGEPEFYGRLGFSLGRAQRLQSPYPIAFTLIARRGADRPAARLVYPAAFGGA